MNSIRNLIACAVAVALFAAGSARAVVVDVGFPIEGSQEVPPVATAASGTGMASFDTVTNLLSWDITHSGIATSVTGAHFHGPAPVGVNAGIQVNVGAVSGLASPMIGSSTISNSQEQELLNGLWYVNIHSTAHSGGEIRGQVASIPLIEFDFPLDGS